jgi:hypothetical protein
MTKTPEQTRTPAQGLRSLDRGSRLCDDDNAKVRLAPPFANEQAKGAGWLGDAR